MHQAVRDLKLAAHQAVRDLEPRTRRSETSNLPRTGGQRPELAGHRRSETWNLPHTRQSETSNSHFIGSRFVMKFAMRLAPGGSMFANTATT